jgi:hypothetical protein
VKNENTPQGGYESVEKALYLCIDFSGGLKTPTRRDKLRTPAGKTCTTCFTEQFLYQTFFSN